MAEVKTWKSGRGLLGPLNPLLGRWTAEAAGPGRASVMRCERRFELVLDGKWIPLDACWQTGPGSAYEETALFGRTAGGTLGFFSFTSDGKSSQGVVADGADVHPEAVAFEARMPAGLARFVYWPAEVEEGFYFAVESRTRAGWNRFMRHQYRPAG